MVSLAPSRTSQTSLARGMFRSVAPELIPSDGAFDILNGLLYQDGAVYKRGGSEFECADVEGTLNFLWSGWLSGGQVTVASTATTMYKIVGGIATPVGGGGFAAPARVAVMAGKMYMPGGATFDGVTFGSAAVSGQFYATVASRLLVASGDTIQFSQINDPLTFDPTDFHQLPGGVQILGMVGLRDAAVVLTTDGIYVIGNMAFNLTDDLGNAQQSLDRYSEDLVLWGEAGISGWSGSLVIPALDGVWLMSLGLEGEAPQNFQKISGPIDDLYRDYVRQGAIPGLATVHRSHYILPILLAGQVIDVLVCRLDGQNAQGATFPWSHMAGLSGACPAYATRLIGTSAQLLAITAGRQMKLHWFDPTELPNDADGSVPEFIVITRDYQTGPLNKNTILKVRLRYDLRPTLASPQPVITASVGVSQFTGSEWGLFDWGTEDWTAIQGSFAPLDGEAPVDVGASSPFSWRVGRKVEFGRFVFRSIDECSLLALRGIEVFVRDSGKV